MAKFYLNYIDKIKRILDKLFEYVSIALMMMERQVISRVITFLSDEFGAIAIGFIALVVRAAPVGGMVMTGRNDNPAVSFPVSDRHGVLAPTG